MPQFKNFVLALWAIIFLTNQVKAQVLTGRVCDATDNSSLSQAIVTVGAGGFSRTVVTDVDGLFSIKLQATNQHGEVQKYNVKVTYVGYKPWQRTLTITDTKHITVRMKAEAELQEVVVTAREGGQGPTSTIIGREAMQHLQPNSIADIMELLPGGYAKDPDMGSANTISLRETGTLGAYGSATRNVNYSISSLGTQFVVDGVPISTDANLQYSPMGDTQSSATSSTAEGKRNITNRGVDMRAISTDDIESVEVVRGIPSAEYGNLTSGVVNIRKIRRATPLSMRFKADGYSKLFALGKGFAIGEKQLTVVNIDLGYLDSKIDPTDNLENYKRVTGSLRLTDKRQRGDYTHRWSASLEYAGSFDNSKEDPDINYGNVEEYRSSYNRVALSNTYNIGMPERMWLSELEISGMVSMQFDRLRQRRLVAPQRYGIVPLSYSDGENEAGAVFSEYVADYLCDGKPFNAYLKAKGVMHFKVLSTDNTVKFGLNWDINKNFGRGQVYDMNYPLSVTGWSSRPRKYSDIPALQNLSAFAEELMTLKIGASKIDLMGGLRLSMLPGLKKEYYMSGRVYADPRVNMSWHFPKFNVGGKPFEITLNGGYGITTKMPTLNYFYPDKYYTNFICLAYYDTTNPTTDSKFVVHTYIQDPTNYNIRPARNRKWELRLDMHWNDNSLSVDYFQERMTSGFRYSTVYGTYTYNYYDASQMTAGRDYTTLPYEVRQVLDGYTQSSNGSRLLKHGIELQFTSQRIKALRTRLNITGAWFRSTYTNSQPMFESVSTVINNQAVRDKYVGLYNWSDGRKNDRLNTNFTFDTQIPEWKLIFTTSFQCMWHIRTQTLWKDGTPMSYIAADDGELHPFTAESADDIYLQQLIKTYNTDQFTPFTVPMSMTVNLKVTKEIGRYMRLSLFANKILDYMPDYEANGKVIRRNVSPYFGVEANLTL